MKKMLLIHLPSRLLPKRWKTRGKSTITLEGRKGRLESTQPPPVVEDFSDETSPRLANSLRRRSRVLDLRSLSGYHNADDEIFPPISTHSSLSSANAFWPETSTHISPRGGDDFCFVCQQPRTWLLPLAGTKHEVGSFNNVSPSPSPPPVLRPRNRPLPCKAGKGKEEEESDESIILWDEVYSPAISTCPHVLLRGVEDFCFICQQPRTSPLTVADPGQEDGSIISRSKESGIIRNEDVSSPSVSLLPVLRPRNRPSPVKLGEGDEGDENNESTILWDEFDSPPVSPPPALRHHNRTSRCQIGQGQEGGDSDESVIRACVEDGSPAILTPSFLRRRNRPLPRNLKKLKQDEESEESTILWDEVPPALRPRHREATIPIPNKSKGKGKEEGAEEEDGLEWAVNSLSDTASEEIWLFAGMNYPFEFIETRCASLRSGSWSWSSAPVSSYETGSTMDTAKLWSGDILAVSSDLTTILK